MERPVVRPTRRLDDNTKTNLKDTRCENLDKMQLAQDIV